MKKLAYIFCLLLIISCSTQTISVDYDRGQDFSQIKDYRIEVAENQLSELNINRIETAIQNELSAKSMVLNKNSENKLVIKPDEYISESQDSNVGIATGTGGGHFGTSIGINIPITSKKLNQQYWVSLYNVDGNLIWDGRLDIQLSANGSSKMIDSAIQKGVQKLFKKFPPKK